MKNCQKHGEHFITIALFERVTPAIRSWSLFFKEQLEQITQGRSLKRAISNERAKERIPSPDKKCYLMITNDFCITGLFEIGTPGPPVKERRRETVSVSSLNKQSSLDALFGGSGEDSRPTIRYEGEQT